nr:NAD-glutamate dehydrogenase [Pseudomonadota bacterium]
MPKNSTASADSTFTLEALTAAFAAAGEGEGAEISQAQDAFLATVLEDFRPEELPGVGVGDLAAVLADFWRFGADATSAGAEGGSPAVRLVRAKGANGRDLKLDVLEIVQPDAPFLVDSVMAEVGESGAGVKAMFHPIVDQGRVDQGGVDLGRAPVSMIQVWLAPVGEERRAGLIDRLLTALSDVRAAVADFPAMLALMARSIVELTAAAPGDPAVLAEDLDFLRWIDAGHFVFLGARVYDYPRTADGGYAAEEPLYQPQGSLGVLRDQALTVLRRASEPAVLSGALRQRLEAAEPVIVAKSNLRSRVHRRVYMDYIGVRRYGADVKPSGEVRFVGLFTAQAYDEPARVTPLLRRKLAKVMAAAGYAPGSHNALRLTNILETYPRDELFQIGEDELLATALGILHLSDRPQVKLFVRRDPFDRFFSVLLYAPRERYTTRLRERAGEILARAYGGRVSAYYPSYSDAPLARVHFIIGVTPGDHLDPDLATLEAEVTRASRTWSDDLEAATRAAVSDPAKAPAILAAYEDAFPPGYRDRYDAEEALADLLIVEGLGGGGAVRVRAFRKAIDSPLQFRFKLYRRGETPASLARVLPILGDMGLSALVEEGFPITPRAAPPGAEGGVQARVWIHEFMLEDEHGGHLAFEDIKGPFEAAFRAVWNGQAESDGFNRLVLELGVSWRQAALMRALARYRQQSGLDPRQAVQEAALSAHPVVTKLLFDLFAARFDPATGAALDARTEASQVLRLTIEEALRAVESLDADRVLRRLAALVGAITRTNYYQSDAKGAAKPYIAFKVASRELIDLPAPKPFREIYVSAPNVEAVHLRFGPVARGGLRWSDRRDDFRTEVLGLVKAQQV